MAGMRICEPLWTQASPTLGINNDDCGPCSDMHCVQDVVQGGGNVAVGLWVVGFGLECGCVCQWVGVRHSWVIVRRW